MKAAYCPLSASFQAASDALTTSEFNRACDLSVASEFLKNDATRSKFERLERVVTRHRFRA